MTKTTAKDTIRQERLIVIARGVPRDYILPLAEALYQGGVRCMEIPLDQTDPNGQTVPENLRVLRERFGDQLILGVGTVLTPDQVCLARDAGADFVVSPGTDIAVIRETGRLGLISIPGALTPGEIVTAYHAGADFVKLFPASLFGPDYVATVRAPLPHIPLLAMGGITYETIPAYQQAGISGYGIGGPLVNRTWLDRGDYARITAEAARYCAAVKKR